MADPIVETRIAWPGGAKCAVLLSFDFDAETLWIGRDKANWKRPGILSHGRYGANLGVPKILETLEDAGVPATFFVPGWTAENHTIRVEQILERGHEVAHHSYLHEWIDPEDPAAEEAELDRGLEALQKTVGVVPSGYRSPAGETSDNMVRLLTERGFVYDSSLMDHINPYRHPSGLIELPWHWSLDDAIYALFSVRNPRPVFPNSHILEIWQEEFREIHAWGGLFDLVMHPQITGRPSRIRLLREMIAWIQSFPDVWFATARDIADAWAAQERSS